MTLLKAPFGNSRPYPFLIIISTASRTFMPHSIFKGILNKNHSTLNYKIRFRIKRLRGLTCLVSHQKAINGQSGESPLYLISILFIWLLKSFLPQGWPDDCWNYFKDQTPTHWSNNSTFWNIKGYWMAFHLPALLWLSSRGPFSLW